MSLTCWEKLCCVKMHIIEESAYVIHTRVWPWEKISALLTFYSIFNSLWQEECITWTKRKINNMKYVFCSKVHPFLAFTNTLSLSQSMYPLCCCISPCCNIRYFQLPTKFSNITSITLGLENFLWMKQIDSQNLSPKKEKNARLKICKK